jgi:hypothetical protein
MARNMWLVQRLQPTTVANGYLYLCTALEAGAPMSLACRFAGYALECERQGRGLYGYTAGGLRGVDSYHLTHAEWWERCARSSHKYASARHGPDHEITGRRLLEHLAPVVGLARGSPPEAVLDKLYEWPGSRPSKEEVLTALGHGVD